MSWEATAYVNSIVSGITAREKLVAFVLSNYHHHSQRVAWPSIPLLAKESLTSERGVYKLLEGLETSAIECEYCGSAHPVIRRVNRGIGLGNGYIFPGLDCRPTPERRAGVKRGTPERTPEQISKTPEQRDSVIRKEPFEPISEGVNSQFQIERREKERRSGIQEATKRGLRDFVKYPPEPWEEGVTQ